MVLKKPKAANLKDPPPENRQVIGTFNHQPVEIIRDADSLSSDVSPFLDSFMADISNLRPLPELDLTTEESARAALEVLDRTQEQIQAHLRTAQALKQVLIHSRR
jgi:hypothetical protein